MLDSFFVPAGQHLTFERRFIVQEDGHAHTCVGDLEEEEEHEAVYAGDFFPAWEEERPVFETDTLESARSVARWMSERTSRVFTVVDTVTGDYEVLTTFFGGEEQ
jgi:hypothetical protein